MKQWRITEKDVKKFVSTLDERLQRIYETTTRILNEDPDTLTDEFQISAQIQIVFWDYVEEKLRPETKPSTDAE
jgi:hypothetical protein